VVEYLVTWPKRRKASGLASRCRKRQLTSHARLGSTVEGEDQVDFRIGQKRGMMNIPDEVRHQIVFERG
jgi:hypothetical protein